MRPADRPGTASDAGAAEARRRGAAGSGRGARSEQSGTASDAGAAEARRRGAAGSGRGARSEQSGTASDAGAAETVGADGAPDDAAVTRILTDGELTVTGRLTDASNVTLLGSVTLGGAAVACVYKPIRGERPLWDFPDGTLAGREVASYLVADVAGWGCVPVTVLRDGPFGPGMVQQWITDADPDLTADLLPAGRVPDGWLPVLSAEDMQGNPVVVAHADTPALAVLAGFDLVVNNADRKASHILPTPDGRIRGVDHGVTLHEQAKLRTILWGWAGRPLPGAVAEGLDRLAAAVTGDLADRLRELITTREIAALVERIRRLRADPRFPSPPRNRTPIPWPPL